MLSVAPTAAGGCTRMKAQATFSKGDEVKQFDDERYGWREMGVWTDEAKFSLAFENNIPVGLA